jgi:hypothetical protein
MGVNTSMPMTTPASSVPASQPSLVHCSPSLGVFLGSGTRTGTPIALQTSCVQLPTGWTLEAALPPSGTSVVTQTWATGSQTAI